MAKVEKVRKRSLTIEGVYLDTSMTAVDLYDAAEWCGGTVASNDTGPTGVVLETLDGNTATVHPGWWILKGVAGEFYPCAPDVFDRTYDVVGQVDLSDRLFVRGTLPVVDLPDWLLDAEGGLTERGEAAMFGSDYESGVPNFSALDEPMAWVLTAEEAGLAEPEEPRTETIHIQDLDGNITQAQIVTSQHPVDPPAGVDVPSGVVVTQQTIDYIVKVGGGNPAATQQALDGIIAALRDGVVRSRGQQ